MTIRWKAVEQHFTAVLFVFQVLPVCNFERFIYFSIGIVMSEKVEDICRFVKDG